MVFLAHLVKIIFTFINGEEINLQNKVLMFSFSLNT